MPTQAAITAQLQAQAFVDVPYLPLAMFFQPTATQKSIAGCLQGLPLFWNAKRS